MINLKNITYAGFLKRVQAGILDVIILSPLVVVYTFIQKYCIANKIVAPLIIYSVLFLVQNIFFVLKFGGTPGKLLTKIKIVNENGSNISIKQAILREIINLVASVFQLVFFVIT